MDAIAERLGLDRIEVRRRNLIPETAMPYRRELDAIGDDVVLDSGDYSRPARQGACRRRLGRAAAGPRDAPCGRRDGGRGRCHVPREERPRSARRRPRHGGWRRAASKCHRLRLGRAGRGNGHGADLRRRAGRGLPAGARGPRPDRAHRQRHRSARVARDSHDRIGGPCRRFQRPCEGARGGSRPDEGAGRGAGHRRRKSGAERQRRCDLAWTWAKSRARSRGPPPRSRPRAGS